jgi:cytochrome c oxidase cbb3-type subunit 4
VIAGIVTAVLLASFVAGWIWAWRPSRRAAFDAAARLPLDDDDMAMQSMSVKSRETQR